MLLWLFCFPLLYCTCLANSMKCTRSGGTPPPNLIRFLILLNLGGGVPPDHGSAACIWRYFEYMVVKKHNLNSFLANKRLTLVLVFGFQINKTSLWEYDCAMAQSKQFYFLTIQHMQRDHCTQTMIFSQHRLLNFWMVPGNTLCVLKWNIENIVTILFKLNGRDRLSTTNWQAWLTASNGSLSNQYWRLYNISISH